MGGRAYNAMLRVGMRAVFLCVAFVLAALSVAQPKQLWSSYKDLENLTGPTASVYPNRVFAKPGGGYYVCGGSISYTFVSAYDANHQILWNSHHAGGPEDFLVTPSGIAAISCGAYGGQNMLFQFDSGGHLLWNRFLVLPGSSLPTPACLAVDGTGNLYVGGATQAAGVILSFTASGDPRWSIHPSIGVVRALSAQGQNLIAAGAGAGSGGYVTAYDLSGQTLWSKSTFGVVGWTKATPSAIYAVSGYRDNFSNNADPAAMEFDLAGNQLYHTPLMQQSEGVSLNSSGYLAVVSGGTCDLLNPAGAVQFSKTLNGSDAAVLLANNNIVLGGFRTDANPNVGFLAELDPSGNVLWSEAPGGSANRGVQSLLVDANGQIVYANFDDVISANGLVPIYSVDGNGTPLWSDISAAGGSALIALDCRTTSNGYYYVLGGPTRDLDNSGFLVDYPSGPIIISRYAPSGRLDWSHVINPGASIWGSEMRIAPGGGAIVLANSVDAQNLNSTAYLYCFDLNGKLLWTKTFPNWSPKGLDTTSNAIYLAAQSGTTTTTRVFKLDANGAVLWQSDLPVPLLVYNFRVDAAGAAYSVGESNGSSVSGSFVTKLDTTGAFSWSQAIPDATDGYGNAYQVEPNGASLFVRCTDMSNIPSIESLSVSDGTVQWTHTAGTHESYAQVIPDGSGGAYLHGNSGSPQNGFFRRLDANGNVLWTLAAPGSVTGHLPQMAVDTTGVLYAAARGMGATGLDYLLYRVQPNGTFAWPSGGGVFRNGAIAYDGGGYDDISCGVSRDPLNNLIVAGFSYGPNGTPDMNLVKYGTEQSQYVSQAFPATMTAGHMYNVSVTMKNTGQTTWTLARDYSLVPVYPIWGVTSVALSAADSIAPGQSKTFTFSVLASSKSGSSLSRWTMQRGSTMFGAETALVTTTLSP